jgi:hypothetical protein
VGYGFVPFQSILTHGAHDWEFFTIDNESYLVVANYSNGSTTNVDSKIYQATICQLYGIHDEGLNDTQFFTVSLDTLEVKALGESYPSYDIESLDAHPDTNALYAASGDDTDNPRHLYTVNTQTGALNDMGSTGFTEIEGLTFHPDGTLWAWAARA